MKKNILMLIGIFAIISIIFISCSNGNDKSNETITTPANATQSVIDNESEEISTLESDTTKKDISNKTSKTSTTKKNKNTKIEKVNLSTTTTIQTTEKEFLVAQNGPTRLVKTTVYVTSTTKKTTTTKNTRPQPPQAPPVSRWIAG